MAGDFFDTIGKLVTIVATGGGVLIAWGALDAWKSQLTGTKRHECAAELGIAVRTLEIYFFTARSVLIENWEFPPEYHQQQNRTDSQRADALLHVYRNRWNKLVPHIQRLADLRPKVGTLLGDHVLEATTKVAACVDMLWFWMEHAVQVAQAGAGVSQWTDQQFVAQIRPHVHTDRQRADSYSREFHSLRDQVFALIEKDVALA